MPVNFHRSFWLRKRADISKWSKFANGDYNVNARDNTRHARNNQIYCRCIAIDSNHTQLPRKTSNNAQQWKMSKQMSGLTRCFLVNERIVLISLSPSSSRSLSLLLSIFRPFSFLSPASVSSSPASTSREKR